MSARPFPLGAALTVALGALGPPDTGIGPWCELGDFYQLVGWLVGDIPTVEQIGGHTVRARLALLDQHPQLADVSEPPASDAPDTEVLAWLADMERQHGATITIIRGEQL